MQLHIYKDADEVTTALAEWITRSIGEVLLTKDRFTIALSGGETPKTLYKKLATAPFLEKIDWSRVHFFWGDERVVPFSDERNNAKMAFDELLDKIKVPDANIHIMLTGMEPAQSATQYEKILHQYFDGEPASFDLVLLGMGDDGHTLSLFPNSLALFEINKWVSVVDAPDKKTKRITLMPSLVNKSASVVFLVTGAGKAKTLREVLQEPRPLNFPAQLINPLKGELHWFIDEAAAAELKNTGR